MIYKEVVNKKILKLEKDKSEVLRDLASTLDYLSEQIKNGNIDEGTYGIVTKLFMGVSTIDEQLQLLYDVRKEASEKIN